MRLMLHDLGMRRERLVLQLLRKLWLLLVVVVMVIMLMFRARKCRWRWRVL